MTSRHPLRPDLIDVDAYRRDHGLDSENRPISLSPKERDAADHPGERAEPVMADSQTSGLHLPAWLVAAAGAIGSALAAAAVIVPAAWQFPVLALAGVALFLAGKALPTFGWAEGKPLVPLALVPILSTIAVALGTWAASVPPGLLHSGLILAAAILAGLAGKAAPQTVAVAPAT